MVMVVVPFSSVALAFLPGAGAIPTDMDTILMATRLTGITAEAITVVVTTAAATLGVATMVAVTLIPVTLIIVTVPAMVINQAWCVCSSDSLEPVTIAALSMELWGPVPATLCVPTSTIMAHAHTA